MLSEPPSEADARDVELVKGPNISGLPEFDRFPDSLEVPILLKVGDDISTDDISPAGAAALPYRSNIPKLAQFAFVRIDEDYPANAEEIKDSGGHAIVGGDNYGQGSSREHAAICPRYLGLRVVIAKSFARIHWQNLANFGILALEFADGSDYDALEQGATLSFSGLHDALQGGSEVTGSVDGTEYTFRHQLSPRQVSMVLAGGLIRQIAEAED
jgi:aconitate hydratase